MSTISPPTVTASESLAEVLAKCLPEGIELTFYHTSTPPTRCQPLFAPPPASSSSGSAANAQSSKSQRTYCESHSLLATIPDPDHNSDELAQVAVFAIEVQVFTTATLTTVFVSKADSTGYLSLLPKRPRRSTSSPLQSIAATFVSWIIQRRHRPDRSLVLSLFARAQNQYLFPGSGDNGKKHVLDDRALVKWWCKTLDPVLRQHNAPPTAPDTFAATTAAAATTTTTNKDGSLLEPQLPLSVYSKAHLIVPGHDPYETQAFFPPSSKLDPPNHKRWFNTHPLRQIAPYPNAPPRSLVPHFPDDPKARFLHELDEEIANAAVPSNHSSTSLKHESPTKRGKGLWKSVRTLDQFWEMMAFRQECCSGRLVGFIWILFTPVSPLQSSPTDKITPPPSPTESHTPQTQSQKPPKPKQRTQPTTTTPSTTKRPERSKLLSSRIKKFQLSKKQNTKRTGPIQPRTPRIKAQSTPTSNLTNLTTTADPTKTTTTHYHSPLDARGTLILSQKAYDRMHELFLRLDFSSVESAKASTRRWILETSVLGSLNGSVAVVKDTLASDAWGIKVTGERKVEALQEPASQIAALNGPDTGVTMLTVKKKRKNPDTEQATEASTSDKAVPSAALDASAEPHVLAAGLVRKKPKLESSGAAAATSEPIVQNGVNILGTGLVRKKVKN